ncbi:MULTISPECIES: PRD domain-containing protein [unclassified Corynebacterium]|uniref:PRD domain-containing protein n=1 Tax=unclassified Corynebacterium TaxID=2624378 RepID=UPI001C45E5A5|nr:MULTISPECIES: PRD domain-containing protein [unclassified Corynebacterium]MBV7282236.1 PRD domain-containing protein [Corynebacterium sp. TAE3-ERU30]MBV7302423.1 PRD domain-containing protein [Corynebacterium sp. TAE3-ERU2]
MTELRIARVLSNNAVVVRDSEGPAPQSKVIVGKGLGFGASIGDIMSRAEVTAAENRQEYVELTAEQEEILTSLGRINAAQLAVISAAIDLAVDVLGELHPSIYVILTEHLSAAVERVDRGELIENTLVNEIKAVFPEAFSAAEVVVHYLNANLDTRDLPLDEAAFITLHLTAARTGDTVKKPLATANAISRAEQLIHRRLRITAPGMGDEVSVDKRDAADDSLPIRLRYLLTRLREQNYRSNALASTISRQLPEEWELAEDVIRDLAGTDTLDKKLRGETAFLAVYLHGYAQ